MLEASLAELAYHARMPATTNSTPTDALSPRPWPRLDEAHLRRFLGKIRPHYFDLMLEVKDKERSALLAARIVSSAPRFVRTV